MNKAKSTFIGIVVSLAFIALGRALFPNSTIEAGSQMPGFHHFIIIPIALFFGSIVAGCLLVQVEKDIVQNAKCLPGLYISVPYFVIMFISPPLSAALFLATALNLVMSSLGLLVGIMISSSKRKAKKPAFDEYAETFGTLRSGESVTVGTHPQTDRSGETYYRGVKKIYKDTGFADHTFADGAHYDLEKDKKREKNE